MNGPIDRAIRRKQLELFAAQLAERRRRAAKVEHKTRGYRDENGVWRGGLLSFVKYFWHILEPGKELVDGWVLEAICEHLEAVTFGDIKRLLINVPPGSMKSLLTDVFWPAWMWATGFERSRFVAFSYSASLTERDNGRFRDLLMHGEFQAMYGDRFALRKVGETRITNDKHGWKLATSVGGVGTGERGDIIILDDPHNVKEGESEQIRTETVRWFRESMSDRLNDMKKGAIVIIMQRVHEEDVSGTILAEEFDYVHLCIPMEFVWTADEDGDPYQTEIGWVDPRWTERPDDSDGALMWPERFPDEVVASIRKEKGPVAYSSQYQQTPEPRGGGIFKRDFWNHWDGKFPAFEYIFASLDGAFTENENNDPSALTIWGVFKHDNGMNRAMLIFGWRKFLDFEGTRLTPEPGERQNDFMARQMEEWGLVEWTAETCRHWKVDRLLIENKASGKSAATSLRKRYVNRNWGIQLVEPRGDKVARSIAVQPTFSNGMVFAPTDRQWCRDVIDEMAVFPFGKHDDYTDSVTQAIKHLRDQGLLELDEDVRAEEVRNARLEAVQQRTKIGKIANYMPGSV